MANYANLKAAIDAVIKANGQQEITGPLLNQVLKAMVNALGAGYLFMGIAEHDTNPNTPDQNVFYIALEEGTYTHFGNAQVHFGISLLFWYGQWSVYNLVTFSNEVTNEVEEIPTSFAVFNALKDAAVYDVTEHTGQRFANLNSLLSSPDIDTLIPPSVRKAGMTIMFTSPAHPVQQTSQLFKHKFFYNAVDMSLFTNVNRWIGIETTVTQYSLNVPTSGAVFSAVNAAKVETIAEAGVFDVTANNDGATFASLSALLNDEDLETLIPVARRRGGMSIKYVCTSDNKYVQYRCMAQNFTTDVTQWQGVDDKPTKNSHNLVESGGIYSSLGKNNNIDTWEVGSIDNSGNEAYATTHRRSGFILYNDLYKFVLNNNYSLYVKYYDKNQNYLSGITLISSGIFPNNNSNGNIVYCRLVIVGFADETEDFNNCGFKLFYDRSLIRQIEANISVLKGKTMNIPLFINGQISTSTGELTPVDTFNGKISTDYYIKCRDVVKLIISQGELYIFYYGDDLSYLGYKGINSATKTEITVDSSDYPNAVYFRVWCNNVQANYKPTFVFVKNNSVTNSESIVSLNNRSISVTSPTSITIDTTTNSGYVNYLGNIASSSSYFYTPLLSFTKGTIITLTSRDPSGSAVVRLSKWKQDGSKMLKAISYGTTTVSTARYTVVDEVEYLRFSGNKNTNSYEFTANSKYAEAPYEFSSVVKQIVSPLIPDTTYKKHYAYAMWKVLCIGDSLTSGAYYAGNWAGSSIDENYPRILGRMITGDVTNGGHSGVSASGYYLSDLNNYTLTDYDTFIIWLGTNGGLTDTLDTDVNPYTDYNDFATTNTGYYCRIIEKIKEANPNSLIILIKIFAGPSNPGVPTTNQVINKIATKYSLPVIDNSDLTVAKHPELHCNIDNTHFGKAGNIVVANRVVEKVSDYLFADPIKAEFGVTARTN